MYALNLAEDNRILSVTYDQYAPEWQPRVESFPEDVDLYDYKYINKQFIYDPLPPEPTPVPERTRLDIIEAQGLYTALMTDTLLEEEV